jgi:hypothetical protein
VDLRRVNTKFSIPAPPPPLLVFCRLYFLPIPFLPVAFTPFLLPVFSTPIFLHFFPRFLVSPFLFSHEGSFS